MPQRHVRARARSVIAAGSGPSRAVHARVTLFCSLLHTKGVLYLGVRGCTCRLEMESLPLTSGKLVPFCATLRHRSAVMSRAFRVSQANKFLGTKCSSRERIRSCDSARCRHLLSWDNERRAFAALQTSLPEPRLLDALCR